MKSIILAFQAIAMLPAYFNSGASLEANGKDCAAIAAMTMATTNGMDEHAAIIKSLFNRVETHNLTDACDALVSIVNEELKVPTNDQLLELNYFRNVVDNVMMNIYKIEPSKCYSHNHFYKAESFAHHKVFNSANGTCHIGNLVFTTVRK